MASSSRARARATALRVLLLAGCAPAAAGCWTGALYQASRLHESVAGYTSAWSDGQRLLLAYDVAITSAAGAPVATEPRAAEFLVSDLAAQPEIPVDSFPAVAVDVPLRPPPEDRPIPIAASPQVLLRRPVAWGHRGMAPLVLVERLREGRVEALDLFALPADGTAAVRVGRLYSDALYRDRTAWWAYACLPVAGAVDLALLPAQLATAWPLLLLGR